MHGQREHIARLAETITTATIGIVPFAIVETDAGRLEIAAPEHVQR